MPKRKNKFPNIDIVEACVPALAEGAESFEIIKEEGRVTCIRGVVLLGPVSRNGRRYPRATLERRLSLFEGAKAFCDHETFGSNRSARDILGKFTRPRLGQDNKIRGDFIPLKGENNLVANIAEDMPDVLGFSPHMTGRVRRGKGQEPDIIEDITGVKSIDLVADPATTKGLFESKEDEKEAPTMDEITLSEARVSDIRESRPGLIEEIEKPLREEIAKKDEEIKRLKAFEDEIKSLKEARHKEQIDALLEGVGEKAAETLRKAVEGKPLDDARTIIEGLKPSLSDIKPRSDQRNLGSGDAGNKGEKRDIGKDVDEVFPAR